MRQAGPRLGLRRDGRALGAARSSGRTAAARRWHEWSKKQIFFPDQNSDFKIHIAH